MLYNLLRFQVDFEFKIKQIVLNFELTERNSHTVLAIIIAFYSIISGNMPSTVCNIAYQKGINA